MAANSGGAWAKISGAFWPKLDSLTDFPRQALEPLKIRALHPDRFLCALFDKAPALFVAAIHDLLDALRNPPHSLDDLLGKLRQEEIVEICARLEAYREEF